jgi:tRNA pseudouridine38-40 synthase
LTVGYRGTRFAGWASQRRQDRPTVQATLEAALSDVLGHPVRATAAGRTDAGVHAEAQVVSFESSAGIPADGLRRLLPPRLPDDVWVVDAQEAPAGFNARRAARRRWYRYAIWRDSVAPPASWWGRCLVLPNPLDLGAMRRGAATLLGRQDLASVASASHGRRATTRTIFVADWLDYRATPLLQFEICADAFLRHMARTIVGSLLWIGRGRWAPEQLAAAVAAADRRAAGPTAPAHGLTLHRIDY